MNTENKGPSENEAGDSLKKRKQERLNYLAEKRKLKEKTAKVFDPELAAEQAQIFGNRLKKWRAHLWKWAKRTGTSCFRIYDRDIPDLPFIVDEYERHLHISQILRYNFKSPEDEQQWLNLMVESAGKALAVEPQRIFFKTREQQKGQKQYTSFGSDHYSLVVKENDLEFQINLSDYLDTGLFLDHRDTRALVGSLALNARVLNLFSYTGSFSVYAARGGAASTLSLDLSNTYTEWTRKNLALNGFGGKLHAAESADVLTWLPEAARQGKQYDIIVLDPPTFSNSNKMNRTFDVQKDHPFLINSCLRLLTKDGILIFSNNFKKFKLDKEEIRSTYIDDITGKTIPEDFKGKKPHRCWVIKKDR